VILIVSHPTTSSNSTKAAIHCGSKKKESDTCWWCDSGRRQTRGHLFGRCRAWRRELLALKKKVERLKGKRRGRDARLNVVSLFRDERLTEVILEFLAETEVGRRYE
jgi:hypothetical protein